MKQLLICPNCEVNGKREVLGELGADGSLSVLRFHNGFTKIISSIFSVECGKCGESVYSKKEVKDESIIIRQERISGTKLESLS